VEPKPDAAGEVAESGEASEAVEESFSVSSVHGGIRFELTEKQLELPRTPPEGTEIRVENEPGRRFHASIPPKSKTKEDKNAALGILGFTLCLGAGFLYWGIAAGSGWQQVVGAVALSLFLVFLLAERSLRLSEDVLIENGKLRRLRASSARRQEHSLDWSRVEKLSIPTYLELKAADDSLDIAINVTAEERRWIFEELRRFASGAPKGGKRAG
jgi:hypothetical protein